MKQFIPRTIIIICLCVALTLIAVASALLGVNIYDTLKGNDPKKALTQATRYLTKEIRTCDGNVVRTASLGGYVPALVMERYDNGTCYETWIFMDGNHLKEVTVVKGEAVSMEQGENIAALESADFTMLAGDLLEIRLVSRERETCVMNLYVPTYEGGAR